MGRMTWDGEHCDCCTREQRLAWSVSDKLWMRIAPTYYLGHVLCLECFLRFADIAGVAVKRSQIRIHGIA